MRWWWVAMVLALAPAACARPVAAPAARVFWIGAVEFKGGAEAAQEPYPAEVQPSGPGIKLMPPVGPRQRWETEMYRWDPGTVVVQQGEQVTLYFWGVNGQEHPSSIEGYNLKFNVRRGRPTAVTFRASRTGVFRIVCHVHQPSMVAHLVVLPRPS